MEEMDSIGNMIKYYDHILEEIKINKTSLTMRLRDINTKHLLIIKQNM